MNEQKLDIIKKQVLYRSTHRGCKETDILFGRFVESEIENLSESELLELADLLKTDDAVLYAWFAELESPPAEVANGVFKKMYDFNRKGNANE